MSDRDELGALVRQFRTHLQHLEAKGSLGVRAGRSPRPPRPPVETAEIDAHSDLADASEEPVTNRLSLAAVRAELGDCQRCKLAPLRTNLVFGVGRQDADLMFVGEAPGADEDRLGEPFVGRAGELLTKMILAMGFRREDVMIANILKCRPPGNRNPEPDEIEQCEPFLRAQIDAIRPRVLVALGKFAAQCLLRSDAPISALRGRWHEYQGVRLMPTFHPAYLLRDPRQKKVVWDDLQMVMKELDRLGIQPTVPRATTKES